MIRNRHAVDRTPSPRGEPGLFGVVWTACVLLLGVMMGASMGWPVHQVSEFAALFFLVSAITGVLLSVYWTRKNYSEAMRLRRLIARVVRLLRIRETQHEDYAGCGVQPCFGAGAHWWDSSFPDTRRGYKVLHDMVEIAKGEGLTLDRHGNEVLSTREGGE